MRTVAEVAEVVRAADSLTLACHHPDGDALGLPADSEVVAATAGAACVSRRP